MYLKENTPLTLKTIMKTHEREQSRECNWGNRIENIALVTLENSMQNTIITIPVPEYVKNDYGQHVENNTVNFGKY